MTDRKRLIALLRETEINKINGHVVQAETCFTPNVFEKFADHLIANGVESVTKHKQKPNTNGDDIRAMNDEDLATMLVFERDDWCDYQCPDGSFFDTYEEAIAYTVEWLKQPCSDK